MPTFVATVTDSAGQVTTSAPLVVPAGVAPGGGGTPPPDPGEGTPPPPPPGTTSVTEMGASVSGAVAADVVELLSNVGKPPFTLYHGYSGAFIPVSASTSGTATRCVNIAKTNGLRLYLNTKTNGAATTNGGTGGAFTALDPVTNAPLLNLTLVDSAIRQCVRWLKAEGIKGWICLDHEPQNGVGADSTAARASAARWRAAQKVASRAVWSEDPTGGIGFSVCLMAQWPGFPHLQRTWWNPGVTTAGDLTHATLNLTPWSQTEKDKVLWAPDVYSTMNADGTFESFDSKDADYDYWVSQGYRRMGVGETGYYASGNWNPTAGTGSVPTEQRWHDLVRGWAGTDPPPELGGTGSWIVGSMGEWVYRKSVKEGTLRHFAWYDTTTIPRLERASLVKVAAGYPAINIPLRVAAFQAMCSQIGIQVP